MSTVIKVENLSKRYFLNHKQKERFPTLRDELIAKAGEYGRRLLHPLKASSGQPLADLSGTEEFWALKDVSFEVNQGDRVGIIGRNGAGKSTLLKILSRITEPTAGKVSLKGRVASLLEVGTGFHPELTGRENIYLNGAILGMGKQEIKRKFDEIVDFAEVEKFLDTPVKRYSSGMYVRLAFAVAAHLEPEILIVDEVLAVGDAQFQKKCLGKMEQVGNEGRTILFVSHNMSAVQRLCSSAILLNKGLLTESGGVRDVLQCYMKASRVFDENHIDYRSMCERAYKEYGLRLTNCEILDSCGKRTTRLKYLEPFFISTNIESNLNIKDLIMHVGVDSSSGIRVFTSDSEEFGFVFDLQKGDMKNILVKYDGFSLMPGDYYISKLMVKQGKKELISLQSGPFVEVSNLAPPLVSTGVVSGASKWVEV